MAAGWHGRQAVLFPSIEITLGLSHCCPPEKHLPKERRNGADFSIGGKKLYIRGNRNIHGAFFVFVLSSCPGVGCVE